MDKILLNKLKIESIFSKSEIEKSHLDFINNKSAIDLTLPECAFLAGLTQAPTSYSPYNPANKEDPSI